MIDPVMQQQERGFCWNSTLMIILWDNQHMLAQVKYLKCGERLGEQAKILDFGISKVKGKGDGLGLTRTGQVMGTPYYMAPEQARGVKDIDERIDIWATGVILYQMLSGHLPFPGESYNEVLAKILTEEPQPVAEAATDLPAPLAAVVDKALSKNRDERYRNVSEFAEALKPFGDASVTARPEGEDDALMETVAAPSGPVSVATGPVSGLEKTEAAPVSGLEATTAATTPGARLPVRGLLVPRQHLEHPQPAHSERGVGDLPARLTRPGSMRRARGGADNPRQHQRSSPRDPGLTGPVAAI